MSKRKRNGTEKKILPNTSTSIESSLLAAKTASDNLGGASKLTPNTFSRLNTIQPAYQQARVQMFKRKAELANIIEQKEEARASLLLHTSHFLQVFNLMHSQNSPHYPRLLLYCRSNY